MLSLVIIYLTVFERDWSLGRTTYLHVSYIIVMFPDLFKPVATIQNCFFFKLQNIFPFFWLTRYRWKYNKQILFFPSFNYVSYGPHPRLCSDTVARSTASTYALLLHLKRASEAMPSRYSIATMSRSLKRLPLLTLQLLT